MTSRHPPPTPSARQARVTDPERFRLGRELRGVSQVELLRRLDGQLSAPALSQIETGASRPSPATLARLAAALDVPTSFFDRRGPLPGGYFRSLRATPARDRKQALAYAVCVHDLSVALDTLGELPDLDLPETAPLDDVESGRPTRQAIRLAAIRARRHFGLNDGPIRNVVAVLERHGVVTCRLVLSYEKIDAFSLPYPDRPVVVLSTGKGKTARSRFDAAHELGHLLLHNVENAGTKAVEDEAHAFAAEFLMPAAAIIDELPERADWDVLVDLKLRWRVSIGALLYRAKTLRKMSDHNYVNAVKAMSARGWRIDEPGDNELGPPERPRLLRQALDDVLNEGADRSSLAAKAGVPRDVIELLAP